MNNNCFFCRRKNATCRSCTARAQRAALARAELAAARAARAAEAAKEYFFDSWGGLWVTCRPDEPGAEAFGPRWTACLASPREIWAVWESLYESGVPRFSDERSLYSEAKGAGRTYEEGGWTYLR
jgi:hypothetical protein